MPSNKWLDRNRTQQESDAANMDVMLSDNMKRFLCRSGFMLLCVLPTLLCLKAALFPRGSKGWQVHLQQQFGVINQIDEVQVHSPQRTDFRGLRFGADRFATRLHANQGTLLVETDGTALQLQRVQGSVEAFWSNIQQIIETTAWAGYSDRPVTVTIQQLTLLESDPTEMVTRGDSATAQTITWNDLTLELSGRGRQLSLKFAPEQSDYIVTPDHPTFISAERSVSNGQATWLIKGQGFQLPIWSLRGLLPFLAPLGNHTTIADLNLELIEQNGLWSGKNISGRLLNVNLQDVVANRFGALLTGNARVDFWDAQLLNNQIVAARGEVVSQHGMIGGKLLSGCQDFLGMQVVEGYGQTDEEYGDLRFYVQIDDRGVAFEPLQDSANESNSKSTIANTAILRNMHGSAILIPHAGQPRPVSNLFKMLAWAPEQMNANTAALAKHIKMPHIVIDPDLRMERTADRDETPGQSFFKR